MRRQNRPPAPRRCRLLARAALVAAAELVLASGCSPPAPAQRPADFAVRVHYESATIPPPGHVEWDLEVAPDGRGKLEYRPDYAGRRPPVFTEQFVVPPDRLDALYARLRAADLLRYIRGGDSPVGGGLVSGTLTADGSRYEIPAADRKGGAPLRPVLEDVRGVVPADGWDRIERQRDRYALDRYGRTE